MTQEKPINPHEFFLRKWREVAAKWEDYVKEAKFPETLESQLILFIDLEFLRDYIEDPERDIKELEIFINSVFTAIQESGENQYDKKMELFLMIKKDIEKLRNTDRIMGQN